MHRTFFSGSKVTATMRRRGVGIAAVKNKGEQILQTQGYAVVCSNSLIEVAQDIVITNASISRLKQTLDSLHSQKKLTALIDCSMPSNIDYLLSMNNKP